MKFGLDFIEFMKFKTTYIVKEFFQNINTKYLSICLDIFNKFTVVFHILCTGNISNYFVKLTSEASILAHELTQTQDIFSPYWNV